MKERLNWIGIDRKDDETTEDGENENGQPDHPPIKK